MKIFYDVDTQHDFMDRKGALYVPGAEDIKPNLKKLTDYADQNLIPIFGSVDKHFGTEEYKHREGELSRWGGPFPDHCMADSLRQKKIGPTRRSDFIREDELPAEEFIPHTLDDKVDDGKINTIKRKAETIKEFYASRWYGTFFEKQSYDVFTNPNFEAFLKAANVKEAIVYGVATDYCVKAAVLGMQKRGVQCYVVEDAIAAVNYDTGRSELEEMVKLGAKLIKTKEVLENKMEW